MKCTSFGLRILLSSAYVDDVMIGMRGLQRGTVIEDQSLIIDYDKEETDAELSLDVISARIVVDIANSLEEDITMTFDTPSLNIEGRMPVLDMTVWVEDDEILFSFFEKPMASDMVMMRNSALSWQTKKAALSSEVARRLLNTSPSLVAQGLAEEDLGFFGIWVFSGPECLVQQVKDLY